MVMLRSMRNSCDLLFFFSSRRRHTRSLCDWSSDVCSSDLLLLIVSITGLYGIAANRRAFEDVRRLSGELRSLSWKMMRMQEDLQESFSRELHDEFGQLLTAIGMLLGRVKRKLP